MKKAVIVLTLLLLANTHWGQSVVSSKIYHSNSKQLEEIFHQFITEEKKHSYYHDSLVYTMKIVISDSMLSCKFRAGLSHYRNDTVFMDEQWIGDFPPEYLRIGGRFVRLLISNAGTYWPPMPFIHDSDEYCTVVGRHIERDPAFENIDDSIFPSVWEFQYIDGKFQMIKKTEGIEF